MSKKKALLMGPKKEQHPINLELFLFAVPKIFSNPKYIFSIHSIFNFFLVK